MYDCTTVRKHDHACRACPSLQVFKNALVDGDGMVRVRGGELVDEFNSESTDSQNSAYSIG